MEKMKIAVIGCGRIANSAHIPNYMKLDDVEIKYFCDLIIEKAQACVDKYGCGTAVVDYKEVLADPEIKAVSVCTPNMAHKFISIDAMRAGKHVLCEKPAARVYSEALEMQQVQHETGMTLNIGVVNRFNTAVNAVKKLVESGELGEIYHVYASFRRYRGIPGLGGAFTTKAISGGGALIDCGVHFLDIVMYVTDDPTPITASGRAFSKLGVDMKNYVYESMWAEDTKDLNGTYDVDDFVTAFIRTSGPTITINGSWAQNIGISESYIDFLGTKAGVRLTYGGDFHVYGVKDGKLTDEKPEFENTNAFYNEMRAFIDCVRSGEKLPSHIDRNILTSRIMQGIYDSSMSDREVVFD
ncbi:MAG: Gfo/Idh/MocA family oxidoreductase [Ruminococcaceae bacterium]|nr:Gfo/Idh/MocA family oxidoreductase [Oscillospiraceae bacterium]